jgi:hypothetical protein
LVLLHLLKIQTDGMFTSCPLSAGVLFVPSVMHP